MATLTAKPRPITADEFFHMPSTDMRQELVRGVVCEMPPAGAEHGRIVAVLSALIYNVIKPAQLGTVFGEIGVWVERGPDTVRAPDVAFYSAERMPLDDKTKGYPDYVPDIAVEVVSRNDRVTEVNDKARMWVDSGVRLVWIVWPDWGTVDVHRPGEAVVELSGDATLDGLDVLPGFSVPLTDIFGP